MIAKPLLHNPSCNIPIPSIIGATLTLRSIDPLRFFGRNAYFSSGFHARHCGGISADSGEYLSCRGDKRGHNTLVTPRGKITMPTIRARKQADGTLRYAAIVRVRRVGKVLHQKARSGEKSSSPPEMRSRRYFNMPFWPGRKAASDSVDLSCVETSGRTSCRQRMRIRIAPSVWSASLARS